MSQVIETRNLSKYFGADELLVKALDNVNINITNGEFSAIIGPSGSGKSTLLHLIGGLDNPTHGEVILDGINIGAKSRSTLSNFRRDNIGFVFQAYNLIPVLTTIENIEYIMLLQGIETAERHRRVDEILDLLGLKGLGNRRPAQLSGGQQQRVAVARAMVSKPRLILADEPTANLDSKAGIALVDMMKDLNKKYGMTFVFSTHDEKIMNRAERLIHLRDGIVELDEKRN